MKRKNKNSKKKIVNENDMTIDSFRPYKSSDDNKTKVVDGEKVIEDFHLYKEDKK